MAPVSRPDRPRSLAPDQQGHVPPSGVWSYGPPVRLLIWLVLFLAVLVAGWAVLSAHQTRVRGVPSDFPAPVKEANVPALGVNVALDRYPDQELASALERVADGGFVWVRQSFAWSQVKGEGVTDRIDWSAFDRVLNPLNNYPELRLVAVLKDDPPIPPDDPDQFAKFAGAFAERYGDRVDHYQIWDEPNLASHWGGGSVNPSAYADLFARSARAIRTADPDASILLAGLAPTTEAGSKNLSDKRYLERLYQAGAAPYFDVVAAKPYGFDTGPNDRRVHESYLNVSRVILLREVMVEYGDAENAIWASHWGWNALPQGWAGPPSIWGETDEATQASRSVATVERARHEWPWMGAMIIDTLQPDALPPTGAGADLQDPRWGFSLLAPDGTPRPVYGALAKWARSLPAAAPVGGYPARNRWATYEGGWRAGPVAADVGSNGVNASDGASFRFDGTRVAMTVRRGPYRGFLYVIVDGEPANALPRDEHGRSYMVLYDKESSLTTVPLATGLEPGSHLVEVVAEGGHGQWPLIDWRVGATPVRDGTAWKLAGLTAVALVLLGLLVVDIRRVRWASLSTRFLGLTSAWQTMLVLGLTGVLWATAALSWGNYDPATILSASCLLLSLLTLPVLAYLLALRLDLGLTLVALTAPFYLVPDAMFYRALSLPEVLVVLCLIAYVLRASRRFPVSKSGWPADLRDGQPNRRSGVTFGRMDAAVALLTLAALVAGIASDDLLAALFELRSVFLLPALYYTVLRLTPLDPRGRRQVVDGFLLGGIGIALIGLGQVALGRNLVAAEGGAMRLQSVYHSPNSAGLFLGRVWPFLAAGAGWDQGGRRRRLTISALVLVTAALVLSLSRGALLLALPAAVLAIGWWAGGRYRWMALVLVLVGGLLLIPLLRFPRFAGLLDLEQGTTFFRLKLWRSSLRMIREHPLLGVGPGNYLDAYRTRYVLPSAWEEFNLEHAHNMLLDHWTRLGLLGVVAGLAVQVTFWSQVRRTIGEDALVLGLVGAMAALLAHGLVDNAVFFPDLALTFFLMLAMAQGPRRATGDDRRRSVPT